jgi:hypothetical protein
MILGIDPGLECTGWCILLRSRECLRFGGIETSSAWSDVRRCEEICAQLMGLIYRMRQICGAKPTIASVEQYVYQGQRSQNKNAFRLSRLVGSIESTCRGHGLTVVGPTRGQALMSMGLRSNAPECDARRVIGVMVRSHGGGVPPSNEHSRAAYAAAWWAVGRSAGS